jgi:hypothetical protein
VHHWKRETTRESFLHVLVGLSADDIARLAHRFHERDDRLDVVGWWHPTRGLDLSVRRQHRSSTADGAPRAATRAVLRGSGSRWLADAFARRVATVRSAAEAARALVADDPGAEQCSFVGG